MIQEIFGYLVAVCKGIMQFIWELLGYAIGMLTDWPLGTIVGALLIICILVLVGLILQGVFVACDSWFRPRTSNRGLITEKIFTPAHCQLAGKVLMYHDDEYCLEINIPSENGSGSISVEEDFYDQVKEGTRVLVSYAVGRFSDNVYIKEIILE